MGDAASRALRVALIASQEGQGKSLRLLLEHNGLDVILEQSIRDYDPACMTADEVDVLLVNLDEDSGHEMERLEALIERSNVPILFNEGGVPGAGGWGRKLIAKLAGLAQPRPQGIGSQVVDPTVTAAATDAAVAGRRRVSTQRPALRVVTPDEGRETPLQQVWVLGASLGGPQALKAFLSHLPAGLPVAFVIAQHIGKPFVLLLGEQLSRVSQLRVLPAETGRALRAGEVILVPVDRRFRLGEHGVVELRDEPMRGPYKPCIDEVMEEVAMHYGRAAGAIVFSGMGEDGALGALAIGEAGGEVWAQDADSCVISSMPDAARRKGVVRVSGTPESLAARLSAQMQLHAGAM